MLQSVMALRALSPAHPSARADGEHAVPWGRGAMNAARRQGSQTLPSQQMQPYIMHRFLVSGGRGKAARRVAALGNNYLIALLGISLHPASLSCTCLSQRP